MSLDYGSGGTYSVEMGGPYGGGEGGVTAKLSEITMHASSWKGAESPYSQVVSLFEHEQVKSFTVQGDILSMRLHTPVNGETTLSTNLADPEGFREDMKDLFREQTESCSTPICRANAPPTGIPSSGQVSPEFP